MESIETAPETKRRSKAPVIAAASAVILLAAGYLGLCGWAAATDAFYPNYTINGVEVGGLTAGEAARRLARELPAQSVSIRDTSSGETVASVTLEQLGYSAASTEGIAEKLFQAQHSGSFLTGGWELLRFWTGTTGGGWASSMKRDEAVFDAAAAQLRGTLSYAAQDTSYQMESDCVLVTKAKDGQAVSEAELRSALDRAVTDYSGGYEASVTLTVLPAKTQTAQDIYNEVSGELKNAGYDPITNSITPEQAGADFDVASAQSLLDAAAPGQTVEIPAQIEFPTVTAEELEAVLFRDELGSYTTHVSGTAARISNVKLAASAVDGVVLNSGDVFSYNEVVGQRTAARGYLPAPAYVRGETVDEIGGGVCQPSSTLYLAALLSNLEIVTRHAHRYVPAYVPKGMDATVSWGGPEFEFRNNTDYPIRIVATYSKNYLTMTLYGTKTDDTYVKMTNKVLSTTPFETVYEDDPTLPAGTEEVKVTPYTGYKVETYRNLYAADGTLISSQLEAVSDYKVRNKLILRGHVVPDVPTGGTDAPPNTPADTEPSDPDQIITPEQPDSGTSPLPDTPAQAQNSASPPSAPADEADAPSNGGSQTKPVLPLGEAAA